MATHSSVLAWRIPWTGEPGGLPSMGSHRVGHNWSGLAAAAAANSSILYLICQQIWKTLVYPGSSLVAQMVENLPIMWETWVWSLGREDPLEKEMATHSSILAWKNPMDRGAWWATVYGIAKSKTWLSDRHAHMNNAAENILHVNLVLELFSKVKFLYMEFIGQSICVT